MKELKKNLCVVVDSISEKRKHLFSVVLGSEALVSRD